MDIKEIIEDAKEAGMLLTGKTLRDSSAKRNLTLVITLQELTKFAELTLKRASLSANEQDVIDAERWRYFADNPQTALCLGSKLNLNDTSINWLVESNRLADEVIANKKGGV